MNQDETAVNGTERERNLAKSAYYSDHYFKLNQLCSFAHQIHDVARLKPTSLIEVGIGNGFTSSFLKRAGMDVVTVDINPDLTPDICASIAEMPSHLQGRVFDLVVCCEVLEHLPLDEFDASLRVLRESGKRLYLTLPNSYRTFGIGGFLRLPKLPLRRFDAQIELPLRKSMPKEHFWEVGSSAETDKREIRKRLLKYYNRVDVRRDALNPYHIAFTAYDQPV